MKARTPKGPPADSPKPKPREPFDREAFFADLRKAARRLSSEDDASGGNDAQQIPGKSES